MTPTEIYRNGFAALTQAAAENHVGMTDQAKFWILGKAYRESGLGADNPPAVFKQFDGTNNWGAVYWPSRNSPPNPFSLEYKEGHDTVYGSPVTTLIAVYANQVDGAKGVLYIYRKYGTDVTSVLADPNATTYDFAKALYKHGYFLGCYVGRDSTRYAARAKQLADQLAANPNATVQCVGTRKIADILKDTQAQADDANIREYARMIDGGAAEARAANGQQPAPAQPPAPAPQQPTITPPQKTEESSGAWWKVPLLGALAYGGYRAVKSVRKKR